MDHLGVPINGRFDLTMRKEGIIEDGKELVRGEPFERLNAEFVDGFYFVDMSLVNIPGPMFVSLVGEPLLGEPAGEFLSGATPIVLAPTFTTYTINVKMIAEEIEITASSETEARNALTGRIDFSIEDENTASTGDKPKLNKKPKLPTSKLALLASLISVSAKGGVGGEDIDTTTNSEQRKYTAMVPTGALNIALDERPGISG